MLALSNTAIIIAQPPQATTISAPVFKPNICSGKKTDLIDQIHSQVDKLLKDVQKQQQAKIKSKKTKDVKELEQKIMLIQQFEGYLTSLVQV